MINTQWRIIEYPPPPTIPDKFININYIFCIKFFFHLWSSTSDSSKLPSFPSRSNLVSASLSFKKPVLELFLGSVILFQGKQNKKNIVPIRTIMFGKGVELLYSTQRQKCFTLVVVCFVGFDRFAKSDKVSSHSLLRHPKLQNTKKNYHSFFQEH